MISFTNDTSLKRSKLYSQTLYRLLRSFMNLIYQCLKGHIFTNYIECNLNVILFLMFTFSLKNYGNVYNFIFIHYCHWSSSISYHLCYFCLIYSRIKYHDFIYRRNTFFWEGIFCTTSDNSFLPFSRLVSVYFSLVAVIKASPSQPLN